MVGGTASDGEARAEEVGVSGWVPWFEAGEGGEGRPKRLMTSSEANPDVRSMAPTPRASIPLRSFSTRMCPFEAA